MEHLRSTLCNSHNCISALLCFTVFTSSIEANVEYPLEVQTISRHLENKTLNELISEIDANKDDPEKLVDSMFKLKKHVESECGIRIVLKDQLIKVQKNVSELGYNLSDDNLFNLEGYIQARNPARKHWRGIEQHNQPVELPYKVVFGVTMALCGLFLTFLPIPPVQAVGVTLVTIGGEIAITGGLERMEDDRKNGIVRKNWY